MKNRTTALGKPFAMSLALICAYCLLMATAPPANMPTGDQAQIVKNANEAQPATALLFRPALQPAAILPKPAPANSDKTALNAPSR